MIRDRRKIDQESPPNFDQESPPAKHGSPLVAAGANSLTHGSPRVRNGGKALKHQFRRVPKGGKGDPPRIPETNTARTTHTSRKSAYIYIYICAAAKCYSMFFFFATHIAGLFFSFCKKLGRAGATKIHRTRPGAAPHFAPAKTTKMLI